ncbi:MAG: TSUP family transporter [Rhodocyclaceae bacterium]|nr:TSUP family transporter [Rhodocyclaceae bacterium]
MDFGLLALLGMAALLAGFVDAVAGGGGMIQVPALLGVFPSESPATLFGTNKGASVFGSASAAWRYGLRISIPWTQVVIPTTFAALFAGYGGAAAVSWLPVSILRPLVLGLLLGVFAYTVAKPDFGRAHGTMPRRPLRRALLIGGGIGFYDGFFGPGTGSFLIFAFIRGFGLDFLRASVCAKVVNVATNIAALSFFIPHGRIIWIAAASMAVCNVVGALLGSRMALRHGPVFVRAVFLLVTALLIAKVGFDTLG